MAKPKTEFVKPTTPPTCTFEITFRDIPHFNRIIKEMNRAAGRGRHNWTMQGAVKRHLAVGHIITRTVCVYNVAFDKEYALFLALI